MAAELREAIEVLRRRRAEAMALAAKYDTAIEMLEELDRGRTQTIALQGIASTCEVGVVTVGNSQSTPGPPRRSVKQRVLGLLDEDPDKRWPVAEIANEFVLRGEPLEAKDVDNAVRTALSEGTKEGRVIRVGVGVYQAGMSGQRAATSQ